MQLERKGEVVAPLPAVLSHQSSSGDEILQRRGISARVLGALARHEVQLGDFVALLLRRDHFGAAVEVVYDVEDGFLERFRRDTRYKRPANPEMGGGPLTLGNERIGSLLDSVVKEHIPVT